MMLLPAPLTLMCSVLILRALALPPSVLAMTLPSWCREEPQVRREYGTCERCRSCDAQVRQQLVCGWHLT